jgi:superfamily II DNA or RNA helicase
VGEIGRAAYYPARSGFRLYEAPERPAWRPPQLGAIGALMAHWSLPRATAALVSLPTGTGKTAVGVAAPHILHANRALVVVPSMELRRQMSLSFRDESVLRRIGALPDDEVRPVTIELTGRVGDWAGLQRADVVVAIPASISPEYYEGSPPPSGLFDLVVVDEAHHSPARTWRAISTTSTTPERYC